MEAVKTFFMNKENYPMITMVLLGLTIIILLSCVMKSEKFRFGRREQTLADQAAIAAENATCALGELTFGGCNPDKCMKVGDKCKSKRSTENFALGRCEDMASWACPSLGPYAPCYKDSNGACKSHSENFRQTVDFCKAIPVAGACVGRCSWNSTKGICETKQQ